MNSNTSRTILKPNFNKYKTKSKKIKIPYIYDFDEVKRQINSYSCDKKKTRNKMEITNNIFEIENIDDLDILPLKNIDYILSAWKSSKLISENFEKKILNKKDFEIIYDKFDIKTKNENASKEINDEKFWILFSEYLIKENKVKNDEDFLKIMNNAFSNLDCNCSLLIYYYFDKIKQFHPIIKNGKIEVKDELYFELLDKNVKNKIKCDREKLKSDVKITSNRKINKNIQHIFYEYTTTPKKFKKL